MGDQIEIHEEYDDGWAQGVNLTTKAKGVFPKSCLVGSSVVDSMISDGKRLTVNSFDRKRVSSLYAAV